LRPDKDNSPEPIALETTVVATGARPGDSSAKRELFTEETQTVLVFERGAVIRLSAAVADGQLLFLTNKSTGKEVVTQVVRKRAFRPTNCYVDLEFTEACPGFWGIDFPQSAATPTAAGDSVAKKLASDEDSEDQPAKSTAPPSAHEVEGLKQEVTALQTQLKSLMTSKPAAVPSAPVVDNVEAGLPRAVASVPASSSFPAVVEAGLQPGVTSPEVVVAGLQTGAFPQTEVEAATEISADLAKKEEDRRLEELFAMEAKQEDASSPKILLPDPHNLGEAHTRKKAGNPLLNTAAVLLLLGAGSFAAYRFGALDDVLKMVGPTKPAPSHTAAAAVKSPAPKPVVLATTSAATSADPASPAGTADAANVAPAVTAPLLDEKNPATVADAANETEWKDNAASSGHRASGSRVSGSVPTNSATKSANSGDKVRSRGTVPVANTKRSLQPAANSATQPATVTGNTASPASPSSGSDSSVAVAAGAEGVIAPKLIRGHTSMAPPEMIRNYITGNVNVDAIVDAAGHVRSVTVLSGPEKLRATAIEEMKQYLYQPARKNGKPVLAHVQVSLQFWYEP
jgi:hypothetical protein